MIGVFAREKEHAAVREFFELFKTPWEFARVGREYEVVICAEGPAPASSAKLVLFFGGDEKPGDREKGFQKSSVPSPALFSYQGNVLPIYGACASFASAPVHPLKAAQSSAAFEANVNGQSIVRIGFDLFAEVSHLLTQGQPQAQANEPTLEWHIALVRDEITSHGIPVVEIPAIPDGHSFITCLTHDVDHVGVRNHLFDHTMLGFVFRATAGSVLNLFRGRQSPGQVAKNWLAVFSLPFVHLGLAKDFWYQFEPYRELEAGRPSTFFVIPKKGETGLDQAGNRRPKRAAQYDAVELGNELRALKNSGAEIGVHGIDAWRDSTKGREELDIIARLTGATELGTRMHWLFFDEQATATLERAGFSYDSTVGYNGAIGYRAGTTQAYKPFNTARMLELPMHIMDTALFYPSHMNLSPAQAQAAIQPLLKNARRFGGTLIINWHDRSIAPERLWHECYVALMQDSKEHGAWFATAGQAVSWFRMRRSVSFEQVSNANGQINVKVTVNGQSDVPGLRLRVYKATEKNEAPAWTDMPFKQNIDTRIAL